MSVSEFINKFLGSERLKPLAKILRPWVIILTLFLVLRYTGALAGISVLANQTLLKTGVMDANTKKLTTLKDFDFNFTLSDLENNAIDVKQFKGKTIFINIWATWCGPCRAEMPSIQNLYNKVDHEKVIFIMLSLDREQDKEKVVKFVKDKAYSFPVYVPSGNLPIQLQVTSIPTTLVISPEGKIVSRESGAANYDTDKYIGYLNGLGSKK